MEWRLMASISLRSQLHPGTRIPRPRYSTWTASPYRRNLVHRHSYIQLPPNLTGSGSSWSWSWKTVSAAQSSRHFTIGAPHRQSLPTTTTATATATTTESNSGTGSESKAAEPKRRPFSRDWTLESDALILGLRKQNCPWREVGKRVGRTAASCVVRYQNTLVAAVNPGGPWLESSKASAADTTILRRRLVEEKVWPEIAKELGVDVNTCYARFKGVLESWLKEGLGHTQLRTTILTDPTSTCMDHHLKQVEDAFQAIFREQNLEASEVQKWFDQYTVNNIPKPKNRVPKGEVAEAVWTKVMDETLVSLKETPHKTWKDIQDAVGMDYVSCLIRHHQLLFPSRSRPTSPVASLNQQVDISPILKSLTPRPQLLDFHSRIRPGAGSKLNVWTAKNDELMLRLKEVHADVTWDTIAASIGVSREYCYFRYKAVLEPLIKNLWTDESIKQLEQLVAEKKPWNDISAALGIHPLACRNQWRIIKVTTEIAAKEASVSQEQCENVGNIKHPAALQMRIERNYDNYDWNQLLGHFSRRGYGSEEARRRRWQWLEQHHPWTPREETSLIQQVLRHGVSQWDRIANNLNKMELRKDPRQDISAAECKIHWKNLDMPVRRAVDINEWQASAQRVFWSAWLHQTREHTGEGDDHIWDNISKNPNIPGDSDQCSLYFEIATGSLEAFDDKTLEDFAHQQISMNQHTKAVSGVRRHHWHKGRSVKLQQLLQLQAKARSRRGLKQTKWRSIVRQLNRNNVAYMTDTEVFKQGQSSEDTDHNLRDFQVYTSVQCKMHRVFLQTTAGPRWSQDELKLLERGIRELGYNWVDIQQKYLSWRDVSMLKSQWHQISDHAARITVDQYVTLLQAVEESQVGIDGEWKVDWKRVALRMPGWAPSPCRRVYEQSYQYMLKHTEFSPEEDAWLLQNVNMDEPQDWDDIAKRFNQNGKDGWQYRLRWCQLVDREQSNT